jgi:hypothetical protein
MRYNGEEEIYGIELSEHAEDKLGDRNIPEKWMPRIIDSPGDPG